LDCKSARREPNPVRILHLPPTCGPAQTFVAMAGGPVGTVRETIEPTALFSDDLRRRHVALLVEHGLEHLDLHEITTSRRVITQTIAADLFDRGASAVRFPSRLDGNACVALFEKHGTISAAGDPSRSPTCRPNRSPRSPRRGGSCWSPRPQSATTTELHRPGRRIHGAKMGPNPPTRCSNPPTWGV
jgi:hypothetical protein